MENKSVLEYKFKSNYDAANNFLAQGNLDGALGCLKKSLELSMDLVKSTYGEEQARYKAKMQTIMEAIKMIQDKKTVKVQATNAPKTQSQQTQQATQEKTAEAEAPRPKIPVEESLKKLDELIGLGEVKAEVRTLVNMMKTDRMRKAQGLKVADTNNHLIFAGNPGTGKTTVARIMADIFYSLDMIEKGHLVEVNREDLVVGYVGQTGPNTQKKIDEAMGGVFFVDEIYRMAEGGEKDFGKEAVGTILVALENKRNDFIAVFAGYESRMKEFIDMNPGLRSRVPNTLHFNDYTVEELYEIFKLNCKKNQYTLSADAVTVVKERLTQMYETRDENFGNARDVRNLFDKMVKNQANRVASLEGEISKETLMRFTPEDVPPFTLEYR